MAPPPLPHAWQHRLDHRDGPEDIGGELALKSVHGRFFQHALMAITRIVHQHVDRTGPSFGFGDSRENRIEIGHIQHDRVSAIGRERGEGLGVGLPPHGADHTVALFKRAQGKGAPQAGTDAGNEKCLGGGSHGTTPGYD